MLCIIFAGYKKRYYKQNECVAAEPETGTTYDMLPKSRGTRDSLICWRNIPPAVSVNRRRA